MDKFAYTIERAKLKQLERLRTECSATPDTTRFYDLSRDIAKSKQKIQHILGNRAA